MRNRSRTTERQLNPVTCVGTACRSRRNVGDPLPNVDAALDTTELSKDKIAVSIRYCDQSI